MIDFGEEPGWVGAFTRNRAAGALANGTVVEKCNSEKDDARPDGMRGVILGSISHPQVENGAIMYWVEWVGHPRVAVGVMHFKVCEVKE